MLNKSRSTKCRETDSRIIACFTRHKQREPSTGPVASGVRVRKASRMEFNCRFGRDGILFIVYLPVPRSSVVLDLVLVDVPMTSSTRQACRVFGEALVQAHQGHQERGDRPPPPHLGGGKDANRGENGNRKIYVHVFPARESPRNYLLVL